MNDQNNPNSPGNKPAVLSGGEKFVAINLLSKIGVVFVIASVIAFSAASEGHIPDPVRLGLIVAVGLLMLGAGELFWRKGSKVFSNAMIYGGAVELMIVAPIGKYGIKIDSDVGVMIYSTFAAALGFLLAIRYRSQILLIVMAVISVIPVFTVTAEGTALMIPVYLTLTHFAVSVIARKKRYTGAVFTGLCLAAVEAIPVWTCFLRIVKAMGISYEWGYRTVGGAVLTTVFVFCTQLCYSGSALLNASEEDGDINVIDGTVLCLSQGIVILVVSTLFLDLSSQVAGIILLLLTVFYAITAVAFSLNFWSGCRSVTILLNFILSSISLAIPMLIKTGNWQYIAVHVFAAVVLILGVFLERSLLKWWGISLLIVAELWFLAVLIQSAHEPTSYRLSAEIVNLILFFGVMAALAIHKKTRESGGFRFYTFAALLNAGFIGSNLISVDLMEILNENRVFMQQAQGKAFSGLLCATLWLALGFAAGKFAWLKAWRAPTSMLHYGIGLCFLGWANLVNRFSINRNEELEPVIIIATVIVNVVSVLAILDITLQISEKAQKFSRAVGLVVSAYAMMSLTTILGTNDFVKFTSCIISILYLVLAAAWIIIGFWKNNALLRRFGLALALVASAKLFLFDFRGVDAFGRTILFIGFGVTLLGISFGYAVMEKRLSRRASGSEPTDKQE